MDDDVRAYSCVYVRTRTHPICWFLKINLPETSKRNEHAFRHGNDVHRIVYENVNQQQCYFFLLLSFYFFSFVRSLWLVLPDRVSMCECVIMLFDSKYAVIATKLFHSNKTNKPIAHTHTNCYLSCEKATFFYVYFTISDNRFSIFIEKNAFNCNQLAIQFEI